MKASFFLFFSLYILTLFILVVWGASANAQQPKEAKEHALAYLDHKTSCLDKYLQRSKRIQERLLRRLKKKEIHILQRLAAKDSAAYRRYLESTLSYDSIAVLSKDTAAFARKGNRSIAITDSLKGIQQFIQQQSGKLSSVQGLTGRSLPGAGYSEKIAELQSKLNAEQQVKDLIRQRTQSLEQMAGNAGIPGMQGIQKDVYYAQEKMKAWRQLADDPDAAEEKAMEYLQGVEGFDAYLNPNKGAFGGAGGDVTAASLESMGYQTKGQVGKLLQDKFAGNLSAIQQSMGQQVQQFGEKLSTITGKVKEAKQGIGEAKAAKEQLKHIEKPAFHKNPERGKPFWQRLEVQYNFQTTRATPDGLRPAMVELGASVAFKHTPRLSYGIGIAGSFGLGQDWQHIRFSYEGVSLRAYADWLLIYGFSAQAGYERSFRPAGRPYLQDSTGVPQAGSDNALKQAFGGQQQTAYLGIMKRYRMGSKWSGTFLAGYDFLWQQSNQRMPFMVRLGWTKH